MKIPHWNYGIFSDNGMIIDPSHETHLLKNKQLNVLSN